MLFGYEIIRWSNAEDKYITLKIPPYRRAFSHVISKWPKSIDEAFIKDLYEFEDSEHFPRTEISGVIAQALFENALDITYETPIGIMVRQLWYEHWITKHRNNINGLIWRDLYMAISEIDFLRNYIYEDTRILRVVKLIISVFANELDREHISVSTTWVLDLLEHLETDELNLTDASLNRFSSVTMTQLGRIANIDLIAILCGRRDWLYETRVYLSRDEAKQTRYVVRPNFLWGTEPIYFHPINEILHSTNVKRDLIRVFSRNPNIHMARDITPSVILHHPWFASLRYEDGFSDWWGIFNHAIPVVPADPLFELP